MIAGLSVFALSTSAPAAQLLFVASGWQEIPIKLREWPCAKQYTAHDPLVISQLKH